MNMMKALTLYTVMIAAAFGIQQSLEKLSMDADAPILAIAKAQANAPFGAQVPPAQIAAIMRANTSTIAADRKALNQAEQQATP